MSNLIDWEGMHPARKFIWAPIAIVAFYALIPVWFVLSSLWWKDDAAFVLEHLFALFVYPEEWFN